MREFREQKILDVVSDYSYRETGGGITTPEITRELKLLLENKIDERTVRRHLAILREEGLVARRKEIGHKWKYYVTRVYLENESYFVYQMRRIGSRMIYPIWLTPDIITKNPHPMHLFLPDEQGNPRGPIVGYDYYPSSVYGRTEPEHEFYESMSRNDVTISNKFCQTKFRVKEEKEKRMFEFVNRIGAFITYIFIKSLEALRKNEKSNYKSTIDNAIDLQSFFKDFRNLFDIISTPGLKEEDLREISKVFRKVYPAAEILEKYWLDTVQLSKRIKSLSK
jgi:DNA-binding transcriptional ArsR family regulator